MRDVPAGRVVTVQLAADEARALDELSAEMCRPADEVVRGALRLLGMTRALHNLHGVLRPVGDPRGDAAA
ncbi:MAG: hypothetical protein AB1416_12190 [Actinomycetota bacterium]